MKTILLSCVITLIGVSFVQADETVAKQKPQAEQESELVKSTFLITGLHCPPCAQTVEESLRNIKGVKSATVDWKTKNARVEFDEKQLPAQQLSNRIAATSHMMGGDMKYGGWLALAVADINESDDAAWHDLKETLSKVEGVKQVAVYKARAGVGIRFDVKGELTSVKIISAMADAGFKMSNY